MASSFRVSTLAVPAVLAAVLVAAWNAVHPATFTLELTLASSVPATSQVFCDLGRGFNEADSVRVDVPGGNVPVACRFALPDGTCRALRFDPINRSGTVTFSAPRIDRPDGRLLRAFTTGDLHAANQIAESTVTGAGIRMATPPGADDPYYLVALPAPLVLHEGAAPRLLRAAGRFALAFVILGTLAAAAREWRRRHPAFLTGLRARARRHPHASLAAVAAAAAVLATYPVVFGGRSFVSPNNGTLLLYDSVPTLPGLTSALQPSVHGADIGAMMWQHLPYTVVQHRALFRDGELPLWDRYDSCGVPLLGQGQSMFGDPLHLPELLAGGTAGAFDFRFVLSRFLFAAGLGFTVWAAAGSLPAAALVAFTAAFAGFFNFRFDHPAIFSVSVAPWVLWCWVRLLRAGSLRAAAAWCLGLVLTNESLLTSGTVKEAYMLLLCVNLAGALALAAAPAATPGKWRRLALAAAAGGVLILLTAPVWLTFRDTLQAAMTSSDHPDAWQIPWNRLVGLFDDLFYRELSAEHVVVAPSLNFVLLLGVLWFVVGLPRHRRDSLPLVLAAGALAAISLVYAWVPGSVIIRLPVLREVIHIANTFSCVAMIFLAVLAGYGFAHARRTLAAAGGWRSTLAVLLLLAALVAVYFHGMAYYWSGHEGLRQWRLIVPVHRFFFGYLALMLVAAVALTLLAAWCLRRQRAPGLALLGLLLAAAILLVRNGVLAAAPEDNDYFTVAAARANLQAPSPAVAAMKAAASGEPFRAIGTGNNLFAGFTAVYGLEGINGPDAVMNPAYTGLLLAAGLVHPGTWRVVLTPAEFAADQPLLDLLNVRFCVTEPGDPAPAGTYRRIAARDLDVYASPTVWPRAFFTDTVVPCHDWRGFQRLAAADGGRPFVALAEDELTAHRELAPLGHDFAHREVVAATDYRLTTNSTAFTILVPGPGVIALQEAYLPGDFQVTIDGHPAHCFRVNRAFKGVAIAVPGTYRVVFTYRPRHWTASLRMAGAGLAVLLAAAVALGVTKKSGGLRGPIAA